MKHFYLLLISIFFSSQLFAQNAPFIMTWETKQAHQQITIPTFGSGYNYTIDFGDGMGATNVQTKITHTYWKAGTYTVTITGDFPRIYFFDSNTENRKRLLSVEQWGDIEWKNMNNAFVGCSNLVVNAIDAPDLSQVTDMSYMFGGASSFNQPIDHWDVSNVDNMTGLFKFAGNFNQPLNSWNVTTVTNMSEMFFYATTFDQTLVNWNVSSVTDMNKMFQGAEFFNQSINIWDVSNVTNMTRMFSEANSFNQPLNNWDVSSVTDMGYMFYKASLYNQPLNLWNVSNVINMLNMFGGASSFNQPLNNWDVSNVTQMNGMLAGAKYFDQDISAWNFNIAVTLNSFIGGSGLGRVNYDNLLLGFYNLGLQNKSLVSSNIAYCDETTRNELITSRGWTITGDYFFTACALTQSIPFITTWEVTQDDLRIDIPTTGTGYNYAIDFGDGHTLINLTGDATHTYAAPGIYTVKIAGNFPRIYFNNSGDKNKILSVEQWGDIKWQSMEKAFRGCHNLVINAIDSPNLSQVTNMSLMFAGARSLNQNIDHWDVSNVTNMTTMFGGASLYNQPLNSWDVSSVTNMSHMFGGAYLFNQPLNNWDVSNVTIMNNMFQAAFDFNQPLNSWNVSNVTVMNSLFQEAKSFNQPLNNWNVSNVTNMSVMFSDAESFNQPLNNWNVSNVTQLSNMFSYAMTFNQNLSNWNFNAVANYTYFLNNTKLDASNYEALLAKFELLGFQNKTLDATGLFYCNVTSYNALVNNSGWTINGDAHLFNCNNTIPAGAFVSIWAVKSPNLSIYIPTVGGGYNYTIDFGDGTVQNNVTGNITHTYSQAGAYMVSITGSFPRIYFSTGTNSKKIISVEQWGNVVWQSMERAFSGCSNLVINATDAPNLSQVTSMARMFEYCRFLNQDINHWNVSNVTNMKELFHEAHFFNKPLNNWDVSNVTDMSYMFAVTRFNQSIDNWDVSSVLNMEYMFERAGYNKSLNNWDVSNVTNMKSMFSTPTFNMPIDNWDVSNVTNMSHMFEGNYMFNQPIDSWDVSNVTNMSHMFFKASSFNQPLNNWDVSSVTDMNFMFSANIVSVGSDFNQPLSNWDVSGVIDMSYMFSAAISFNKDISNWTFNPLVNLTGFLNGSALDILNYEALLNRFIQLGYQNKTLHAANLNYCDNTSRDNLINNMGWTIIDGGLYNNCGIFSNNPFTTTWYVSGTGGQSIPYQNLSISIPTNGYGYSYEIDFGDGTVKKQGIGDIMHTYSQPGNYTVKIRGKFPRLYFYNYSFQYNNNNKLMSIDNWGDIVWANMSKAFYKCKNLIINATDAPNLNNVTNMNEMFIGAKSLNQSIEHWDVSNVETFESLFEEASSFNQPLNNWDISNAISIRGMFKNASSFNQPLNNWDITNLNNLADLFNGAISFNQDLSSWDVSNVTVMRDLFNNATLFDQDLSNWNFNPWVSFSNGNTAGFINNSGLSISNYDALLARFVQLGLTNKYLGATGLEYCNYIDHDFLENSLGWNIKGDSMSTDCSVITGSIVYDENNNGCDPNDIEVDGFMVNANNGSTNFSTFSYDGIYNLGVIGTSFTVSVVNAPPYYSISPASATVTFSGTTTEVLDFCVTANQSIEDLNITLLPTSEARPGFEADYRLVIKNVGTETIANVVVTLQFDDTMQQFVVANPAPGTTTTNTLTFTIGTMQPFQTFKADISMLTFQPPTVEGGDILNFIAEVTPSGNDHTQNDNMYNLAQIVVNSYDPNDKQVLQGEELHIDNVNEYLDYLIRFQNTGTASAINVRILDTLHPKLDWSTLKLTSASHNYYVKITDGNRVEFMFDNIHLPDSLSNEPASHGFVAYKIKPKNNVQVGDIISGDAGIYFDFNPPIITNMVQTQIVDPPLGLADNQDPLNQITVYPNPTNKTLHLFLTDNIQLEEVSIYDLQGKKVQNFQGKEKTLDVENLSRGMYFLKITTDRGVVNRKLVKN